MSVLTPIVIRAPAIRPIAVQEVDIEDHLHRIVQIHDSLYLVWVPVGHEGRPDDEGEEQVQYRGCYGGPWGTGNILYVIIEPGYI